MLGGYPLSPPPPTFSHIHDQESSIKYPTLNGWSIKSVQSGDLTAIFGSLSSRSDFKCESLKITPQIPDLGPEKQPNSGSVGGGVEPINVTAIFGCSICMRL
jgi:hypothetical protein